MRLTTIFALLTAAFLVLPEPARADKSYRVSVPNTSRAGSVELPPGEYTLVLDQSKVRLTEVQTGKVFELEAKVDDSAARKFESTAVESSLVDGIRQIKVIQLGGTKTKLAFP